MTAAILIGLSAAGLLGGLTVIIDSGERFVVWLDRRQLRRKYQRIQNRYYKLYQDAADDCSKDYFYQVFLEYRMKVKELTVICAFIRKWLLSIDISPIWWYTIIKENVKPPGYRQGGNYDERKEEPYRNS